VKLPPEAVKLARRQHGLITRAQLSEYGLSRDSWYRSVRAGQLAAVAPGVVALPGAVATPQQRVLAAVLAAPADAIASHCSASAIWGLTAFVPGAVDVTRRRRGSTSALDWVRVHTPTDLADLRPVVHQGIPVTNPLRTLVDLGQVAPELVAVALERCLVSGLASRRAVQLALVRHARKGRAGIRALRDAIDLWVIQDKPPDSVLELTMFELLRRAHLPEPVFHLRILGSEVDFGFPIEQVVLECDGWEAHGRDRDQYERDRQRDAMLIAAGWTVLRFSWLQITRRRQWVGEVIRDTLRSRSAC
jgi:very-short-patch-repair endonuclease